MVNLSLSLPAVKLLYAADSLGGRGSDLFWIKERPPINCGGLCKSVLCRVPHSAMALPWKEGFFSQMGQ